jgi:CelD/BcsL family acetyltransferase involved in cellulose biosynthesis
MEVKIIRTTEEFSVLKEEWERIESLSNSTTYFSTFHYNYTWWNVNRNNTDFQLFILVVYNNNAVVGIAPLKIKKTKRRFYSCRVLEFLSHGDYADFLIDDSDNIGFKKIIGKILDTIKRSNNKWDEISLTHINEHSLLTHYIFTSEYNKNFDYLIEVPFINFSEYDTFEKYTKSFLPKKTKQYLNRFQREVNIEMVITNENVIDQLSEVHIAQKDFLKSKGIEERHSMYEDEQINEFLKNLYESNNNTLTYILLDVDNNNQIICYYTGYVYHNIFHSYNTAYHPKYQHLAIGKIFNFIIFEENQKEKNWDVFDMGTGRYAWKFEWTNTFNLLYQLKIVQSDNKKIMFFDKFEKLILALKQLFRK